MGENKTVLQKVAHEYLQNKTKCVLVTPYWSEKYQKYTKKIYTGHVIDVDSEAIRFKSAFGEEVTIKFEEITKIERVGADSDGRRGENISKNVGD